MPLDSPSSPDPASSLVREPIYHQLNERLRQLIRSGKYPPATQFLTERAVSQQFQVSRVTANKALASLVTEGLLEFRKGVGTFVRPPGLDLDVQALVSFTARAAESGFRPGTKVLKLEETTGAAAPVEVRSALGAGKLDRLLRIERLRLADRRPVILEQRWLVERHTGKLTHAEAAGSLYEWLTHSRGLAITGADQTIRARCVTAAEAEVLEVKPGSAILEICAVGLISAGPLWWEKTLYRGDSYTLRNQMGAARKSGRTTSTLEFQPR